MILKKVLECVLKTNLVRIIGLVTQSHSPHEDHGDNAEDDNDNDDDDVDNNDDKWWQ